MRQVPYLLIGAGRLARHLSRYFDLAGMPYLQWQRKSGSEDTLRRSFDQCDRTLLAVSDQAIEEILRDWNFLLAKPRVHFSGSVVTPLAWGAHPLAAFGRSHFFTLEEYQKISFVIEALGEAQGPALSDILPGLSNPSYRLPAALKPHYHALVALAANGSTLLWQKLAESVESELGLPWEAFVPLLRSVTDNLAASPHHAFTGPIARGDHETIRVHLDVLKGSPLCEVYSSFVKVAGVKVTERSVPC